MIQYLTSFSNSFLLALALWPLMAASLTLPVLLVQYIRFHRLPRARVGVIYLFMLYILALVAFTLYPMPDNPTEYCAGHHLLPQLNPIEFIFDVKSDGLRAVLQIVMNVVFFVPLGVFVKNLFGRKIRGAILMAFLVSLLIETAQLTGAFGLYPCSYRLFDVGDLLFNTLGALIGFGVAGWLPNWSHPPKIEKINKNPKLLHRLVTFSADYIMFSLLALVLFTPFYLLAGAGSMKWAWVARLLALVLLQFVVPFIWKGRTIVGHLTGVTLDDRKRGRLHRTLFYLARLALVGAIWFANGFVLLVLALAIGLSWLIWRKLPYAAVDLLFRKK